MPAVFRLVDSSKGELSLIGRKSLVVVRTTENNHLCLVPVPATAVGDALADATTLTVLYTIIK